MKRNCYWHRNKCTFKETPRSSYKTTGLYCLWLLTYWSMQMSRVRRKTPNNPETNQSLGQRLVMVSLVWFVWSFRPTRGFEGLQILTYPRHAWPLSSKGSFACHTCCDTDQSFIMVISEDPWYAHLLPSVWQWSCHYLSYIKY